MYRNLNPALLGVSGRQSELIELALTYKFRGLEIDIDDFLQRAEQSGVDTAARFLTSARLKLGGFELPVRWDGELAPFKADLAGLGKVMEAVRAAGADCCYTYIPAESDSLPFHENFEQTRQRLSEIADVLAAQEIKLAIGFRASASHVHGLQFPFVTETESLVTLLKSVTSDNAGLLLDSWDWQVGGGSLELLQSFGAERVAYVRLADTPADCEDKSKLREEQRELPAEGGFSAEALALLQGAGYGGPVTLAVSPECFAGENRDAVMQKCSALFDELWSAADVSKRLATAGSDS